MLSINALSLLTHCNSALSLLTHCVYDCSIAPISRQMLSTTVSCYRYVHNLDTVASLTRSIALMIRRVSRGGGGHAWAR